MWRVPPEGCGKALTSRCVVSPRAWGGLGWGAAEERQQLLEAKKAEETLRAKRLAGLVRNVDAGAVETVAGASLLPLPDA